LWYFEGLDGKIKVAVWVLVLGNAPRIELRLSIPG
jgi:hypothetical protein